MGGIERGETRRIRDGEAACEKRRIDRHHDEGRRRVFVGRRVVDRARRVVFSDGDEAREAIERDPFGAPGRVTRHGTLRRTVFQFGDRRGRWVDVGREKTHDASAGIETGLAEQGVEEVRFSARKFADDCECEASLETFARSSDSGARLLTG